MSPPDLRLRPSRLAGAGMASLFAVAVPAALVSNHPPGLRAAVLLLMAGLLLHAWRAHRRTGLRRLAITPDGRVSWQYAGQARCQGRYAGHALFGSLATFVYVEREGWRRLFGPRRLVVPVDAADPDGFRRLRAWVRLGL